MKRDARNTVSCKSTMHTHLLLASPPQTGLVIERVWQHVPTEAFQRRALLLVAALASPRPHGVAPAHHHAVRRGERRILSVSAQDVVHLVAIAWVRWAGRGGGGRG